MSDLYSALRVSPKKKRAYLSDDDDEVLTPKRLRTMAPTPPATPRKATSATTLPAHLSRFQSLQSSLHHALSHSLATAAVSPSDTGVVPNVLNNLSLTSAAGLSRTCTMDDLKRLCWLWEWDGKDLPCEARDEDNPFLESSAPKPEQSKQWTRGAMGLVITPTTHLSKTVGKRVPAYGIGIEVEMDIDKDMTGGMAAVARWTAGGDQRMKSLTKKLQRWSELHSKSANVPNVPLADLPPLAQQSSKQSALTQRLASLSPKSPKTLATPTHSSAPLDYPPSPTRTRPSSPTKPRVIAGKRTPREFAIPFPITPMSVSRHKSKALSSDDPKTPSTSRISRTAPATPNTPRTLFASSSSDSSRPSTPVNQTGSGAETFPVTPTSSRREALYERIRRRSESQVPTTPSKARITTSAKMSREQLMKLSQEEIRRRCLLGRLSGVAESIWMFFASPTNPASATASPRKRRTLPTNEVVPAIIKSSPVPISAAEAHESISLLTSLCPFFLKQIDIGNEDWLEMPASAGAVQPSMPASPGRKLGGASTSDDELKTLSPRRVKREAGGLREVRERIKRELDASE
ncbi:hypothetical protein DFH11DRAFT_1857157 [Phellopilus nigrolimitatus]|nr:hypothetical protein DFH11DRAFT_1857157 [Phellopilus nigrolimitatus]